MNDNTYAGYLHLTGNDYYIADNKDLNLAKTIWHHYIDKPTNSAVLALSQDGINGSWTIVSSIPLRDGLLESYCNN